jgi:hypothetical protein
MKKNSMLVLAALCLALVAGNADAKGKPSGGGGGVSTNYGCKTFSAGTVFQSSTGTGTKTLLMSTYACYLCNMTTHVCQMQSPDSLVGYWFLY